jgi:hypothetical protein
MDDLEALAGSSGGGAVSMNEMHEAPHSAAATKTLQRAQEFSSRLQTGWIGVEHLLIGLLWENTEVRPSTVAELFAEHGASFRSVWFETQRHLMLSSPIPLPSDGSVPETWTVTPDQVGSDAEDRPASEPGRVRISTEVPVWLDAAVAAHAIANLVTALSELHIAAGGKGLVIDGIEIDVDAYASVGW